MEWDLSAACRRLLFPEHPEDTLRSSSLQLQQLIVRPPESRFRKGDCQSGPFALASRSRCQQRVRARQLDDSNRLKLAREDQQLRAREGVAWGIHAHSDFTLADDWSVAMEKTSASPVASLQPMPRVIVSCRDSKGANNALGVAFCSNISLNPPLVMVGIIPANHSHHMIKETGCFVVNLCTAAQKEMFYYLGTHHGSDEDKLATVGAKLSDGIKVNAPVLDDCPVNLECTVLDVHSAGDHDMFVGKVEYVHAPIEIVSVSGTIDFSQLELLLE
jgi:flavin reductase (DIM6/NTAB) family NADH-FMN oxidoreductase RutF